MVASALMVAVGHTWRAAETGRPRAPVSVWGVSALVVGVCHSRWPGRSQRSPPGPATARPPERLRPEPTGPNHHRRANRPATPLMLLPASKAVFAHGLSEKRRWVVGSTREDVVVFDGCRRPNEGRVRFR